MKKKLLFLNHTLQIGGAEKILVNLLKYIDKSKYDITVMTIVNGGIFIEDVEKIDLEKKDNIPVICSVGRLVYEKGVDILLKIHKKLIDNGVPNILWIIGEGIERASLEKYISDNNLQNTVKLRGYQSNPYKYVAKSDLFVCSSRTEGLSGARIEAALLCKPVVTTDTAGIVEIFGNSTENALITKNDLDSLYEGLYKILTNKDLYQKYSDNIANMENKFSIEKTISAIEDSIDDLLKK